MERSLTRSNSLINPLVDVFSVDDSEYPYFIVFDFKNYPVITDS